MLETYYIGAYWGARRESADACAHRTQHFLECLAACDPLFLHWFKLGQSRKEALQHEIKPDQETLQKALLAGKNRTDRDQVLEDLGFRLGLWTGGNDEGSAGLSIHCGCYSSRVGNSCVIELPEEDA